MKTSWRRLSLSSEDIFKTSWSGPIYWSWSYVLKTSSRRLQDVLQKCLQDISKKSSRGFQDVFKTSPRHLQDVLLRRLQNVFKTSSRRLQDILKTSSRRLAKRCLQDLFKTYHWANLFLLTQFQDVFETFSKRFQNVVQRRLSKEGFVLVTLLRNLWSAYKICQSDKSFSNFIFSHYYLLVVAYKGVFRTWSNIAMKLFRENT